MKYILWGMLLTVAGASAFAQVDTTGTRRPSYPDSITSPSAGTDASTSESVKRAIICTGIANHEPIDSMTNIPATTGKVFFFTEIAGLEGKTIKHRWIKDGSKVADIRLSVASNRYRCHSSRSVSGKTGNWTAQVLDEDGKTLKEVAFTVGTPGGETPLGMR